MSPCVIVPALFFYARAKIFVSGENNNSNFFFFNSKRKIKDIELFLVLLKLRSR